MIATTNIATLTEALERGMEVDLEREITNNHCRGHLCRWIVNGFRRVACV